jgi:hypothetical protein
MSAAVPRAIIPSNVLLPTPLPPNTPTRCPRPTVSRPSMTRTPLPMGSVTVARARGFMAGGRKAAEVPVRMGPCPSSGCPSPSITRPSNAGPAGTRMVAPRAMMRSPGQIPDVSPSGTETTAPSRKPTTSACRRRPSRRWTSQTSPTEAMGPEDSTTRPETRVMRPAIGAGSKEARRWRCRCTGN